jgi:LDH2 family malate/lactate/ureidoglycolate dehydrogenase
MPQSTVRVDWETLKEFTKEVFVRADMSPKDAEIQAEALVWANLRGVDSHGVLRIPYYLENIGKGVMNPKPNIRINNETPAILSIDADRACGPVVTVMAMNQAIEKAEKVGIGWVLISNTTHQGAIGFYSQIASKKDMSGIVFACSCGTPKMAPYGAKAAAVHNSPIAISVPAKHHPALILDIATSVAAGGKIKLALDKGISMPVGWALDKDGNPATDPSKADCYLPFGGHKGSGLALMFECLSSVMVGYPLLETIPIGELNSKAQGAKATTDSLASRYASHGIASSVVAAINIGMFTNVEMYKERIDILIDSIKALPKADGFDEILVPGEIEERTFRERSKSGIPLAEGTARKLRSIAEKLGIKTLPSGLTSYV